jgi:hypothetical protein
MVEKEIRKWTKETGNLKLWRAVAAHSPGQAGMEVCLEMMILPGGIDSQRNCHHSAMVANKLIHLTVYCIDATGL